MATIRKTLHMATIHEESAAAKHGPVLVVGLGLMGSALAKALVGAGYDTLVWNRSIEKAAPRAGRTGSRHRLPKGAYPEQLPKPPTNKLRKSVYQGSITAVRWGWCPSLRPVSVAAVAIARTCLVVSPS